MKQSASRIDVNFDQEIGEAFPEVNPGLIPFGYRVLVQIRKPKNKTRGGILIVDEAKDTIHDNTQVAKVIAIGSMAFHDRRTGELWPEGEWFKVGDFVRVPKYGGDRWQVKDKDGESVVFALFNELECTGKITGNPLDMRAYI